jgi:hypothetical protein
VALLPRGLHRHPQTLAIGALGSLEVVLVEREISEAVNDRRLVTFISTQGKRSLEQTPGASMIARVPLQLAEVV